MKPAKWATFLLLLVIQGGFVVSVEANQDQPPVGLCQSLRDFDQVMCLTVTALDDPLADRIPVILVHGLNKNEIPGKPDITVWSGLMYHLQQSEEFNKRFKFYHLLYLSNVQSVRDMGLSFGDLIDQMDQADSSFRGKPLVIIGYSMGGLVARSYMQEPRLRNSSGLGGDRVLGLITLGTPHHGSPFANGPARDEKAGQWASYLFKLVDHGLFNSSLTWSSDNRFDLHWDNYDGMFDYDRYPEKNLWLERLNSVNTFEEKLYVYGGAVQPANQIDDCVLGWEGAACLAVLMKKALGVSQSDGVVPLKSALFDPCTKCVAVRTYPDYNHNEIVQGRSWFFGGDQLFKDIASDLLSIIVPSGFNATKLK